MPVYDYLCGRCGPFTEMRPMAEADLAQACPTCRKAEPRAFLRAPYCATIPANVKFAHATNERSAADPKTRSALQRAHGSGCRCCSGVQGSSVARKPIGDGTAAKGFRARRPWMLSH
jgi:putative FmdB family regulatory protein